MDTIRTACYVQHHIMINWLREDLPIFGVSNTFGRTRRANTQRLCAGIRHYTTNMQFGQISMMSKPCNRRIPSTTHTNSRLWTVNGEQWQAKQAIKLLMLHHGGQHRLLVILEQRGRITRWKATEDTKDKRHKMIPTHRRFEQN